MYKSRTRKCKPCTCLESQITSEEKYAGQTLEFARRRADNYTGRTGSPYGSCRDRYVNKASPPPHSVSSENAPRVIPQSKLAKSFDSVADYAARKILSQIISHIHYGGYSPGQLWLQRYNKLQIFNFTQNLISFPFKSQISNFHFLKSAVIII